MLADVMLFAQAAPAQSNSGLVFLAVLVLGIGLPFFLGVALARQLKMKELGWRIGVIFCSIALSVLILYRAYDRETGTFKIPLGVDLKGGVILVYEVDESATASAANAEEDSDGGARSGRVNMGALVEALTRRVNPTGTKEIVIRPYGDQQVEIIVPEVDQRAVEQIKKSISTAGVLQFRIVANSRDHEQIIDLAREQAKDPLKNRARVILDESGKQVGLWARVGREVSEGGGGVFKVDVASFTVRDVGNGNLLDLSRAPRGGVDDDAQRRELTEYVAGLGVKEIDVLMATNDGYDVNGGHLGAVAQGMENLSPCINFSLKSEGGGARRFAGLTTDFRPEGQFQRQLGILLDNTLLSAPNIREPIVGGNGQITGQFTKDEVAFMVNILQAGSLPVILNPNPISEDQINPLLGRETIEQSKWSMTASMLAVLAFIFIYYRLAGIVGCISLMANLLFTVAIMILINAAFTLPGLAGMVLSVGMSVDTNVLIFERMREELKRGCALRMAIRNGFSRAMGTIIDSNVTTLLTAVVLYVIGTDQIRGFAVTFILGILMSMFTGVFCSRVAFDIMERKRWVKQLKMLQFVPETKFDFMRVAWPSIAISLVVIAVGFVGVAVRNRDILDIDFVGGTTVQLQLKEPLSTAEVRDRLAKQLEGRNVELTVTALNDKIGQDTNSNFKVISSLPEVAELEDAIEKAFSESGRNLLATFDLTIGELHPVSIRSNQPAPQSTTEPGSGKQPATSGVQPENTQPTTAAPEKEQPTGESPAATDKDSTSVPATDTTQPAATKSAEPVEKSAESADKPAEAAEQPIASPETNPKAESSDPAPEGNQVESSDQSNLVPRELPATLSVLVRERGGILAQVEPSTSPADDVPAEQSAQPATSAQPAAGEPSATPASEPAPAATEAAAPTTEAAAPTSDPAVPAKSEEQPATVSEQPAASAEVTKDEDLAPVAGGATPAAAAGAASEPSVSAVMTEAQLHFKYEISGPTLLAEIEETAQELKLTISPPDLSNPSWDGMSSNAFQDWTVRVSADEAQTKVLLTSLKEKFADTPVWGASSKIGSQVAGRMQQKAFAAIALSFLIMVIYVWIRFQHLIFGIAAVVALIHDVAVTVGAIALSAWLTGTLDFLMVDNFKISLPIVAALLTIIGFSINDTIVTFDRIREIRGKSPEVTAAMINAGVNQTLSRTLITAFTAWIVVVILYFTGGEGIHGFAFSLVIGVFAGTYSTVFIAAPLVLWMLGSKKGTARKPIAA